MRALKVKDSVVENIALFDKIPKGWELAPEQVGIGFTKNSDGSFSPPLVIIPQEEIDAKIKADKNAATLLLKDKAISNLLDWAETDPSTPESLKSTIAAYKAEL